MSLNKCLCVCLAAALSCAPLLADDSSETQDLRSKYLRLKRQLKEERASYESIVSTLKQQLQSGQLPESQQSSADVEALRDQSTQELAKVHAALSQQEEALSQKAAREAELNHELSQLQNELLESANALQASNAQHYEALQSAEQEKNLALEKMKKLGQGLAQLKAELNHATAEKSELLGKIEQHESTIVSLNEAVVQAQKSHSSSQQQLIGKDEELRELHNTLHATQERLEQEQENAQRSLSSLQESVAKLESGAKGQIDTLTAQVEEQKTAAEKLQEALAAFHERSEKKEGDLQAVIAQKDAQLVVNGDKLSALLVVQEELQEKLSQEEKRSQNVSQALASARAELESVQNNVAQSNALAMQERDALRMQLQSMQGEKSSGKELLSTLQRRNEELSAGLESEKSKAASASTALAELTEQLANVQKNERFIQGQLERSLAAQAHNKQLELRLLSLQEQLRLAIDENKELLSRIDFSLRSVDDLQASLKTERSQKLALQKKLQEQLAQNSPQETSYPVDATHLQQTVDMQKTALDALWMQQKALSDELNSMKSNTAVQQKSAVSASEETGVN